jgi:hypothetical protein
VPVPDSPRQAVAAGREVQELVATEKQISRLPLALAGLAQATGNLIAAERGLRRLLHLLTLLLTLLVDGEVFGKLRRASLCITARQCASPR